MSDLYDSIPKTVGQGRAIVEAVTAWEATADNRVTRHYAPRAGTSAVNAGEQIRVVDHKLRTLQTLLGTSKTELDKLEGRLRDLVHDFRAPESELATANQALIDLQKRNDAIIKQCRAWKERLEQQRYSVSTALGLGSGAPWPEIYRRAAALASAVKKGTEAPVQEDVPFLRRTPGDAIRYFAAEIMKHAEDNPFVAGCAMGLRMVADDVDNLPQGRP
jgi:hypothetical protein